MRWWAPGSDALTWLTLATMRRLVRASVTDRLVVETAHRIVRRCPPRDKRCEALAIRGWLASNFRFVADPVFQETLRPPRAHLEQWQRDGVVSGDCDDAAVLGAALAASIGFQPFAQVIGLRRAGAGYQHVFTLLPLLPDADWIDLDVTRPLGALPPVTREMTWRM